MLYKALHVPAENTVSDLVLQAALFFRGDCRGRCARGHSAYWGESACI